MKIQKPTNSMYRGNRKFNKEQLIFICDVIVSSTFDNIQGQLQFINDEKYRDNILTYFSGLQDNAGLSLAILYAQLTGDGISAGDVLEFTKFDDDIEKYIHYCKKYGYPAYVKKHNRKSQPESRPIAERIVKKLFEGEQLPKSRK